MDCGAICLRMVAKHYGKSYSYQTLRQRSYITREGVSLLGISDAAESIGMHTMGVKASLEKLIEKNVTPFIAHWRQNHFVVGYKITKAPSPSERAGVRLIASSPMERAGVRLIASSLSERAGVRLVTPSLSERVGVRLVTPSPSERDGVRLIAPSPLARDEEKESVVSSSPLERIEERLIEIRSEEVQEILGATPSWLLRAGISVILSVVVALLIASWFFKYPNVISSQII